MDRPDARSPSDIHSTVLRLGRRGDAAARARTNVQCPVEFAEFALDQALSDQAQDELLRRVERAERERTRLLKTVASQQRTIEKLTARKGILQHIRATVRPYTRE